MSTENAVESIAVAVGGRSYEIARFRGFKAQQILRIAARIGRKYPQLAEKAAGFERSYIDDNKLELSRADAEIRYGEEAREVSEEAWSSSNNVIYRRRMPGTQERLAAIWPDLLEAAEVPALELLAVVSLTNAELADADEADKTKEVIADRRRLLLSDGYAEELFDLAVAGYEVGRTQFGPLVAKMAPLLGMLGLMTEERGPTTSSTSPTTTEEAGDSSPASSDSPTSPSSSTDSPPPTDGPGEKPSGPPGSPSDDSPSG